MGLLDRINQRASSRAKAFSAQPPFWQVDESRLAALLDGGAAYSAEYERIENDFRAYTRQAYKGDSIVFAVMAKRLQVFAQAAFRFQRMRDGKPADFFWGPSLSLLERPWPNGTLGELLSHMEQDASLAGNFYATTVDDEGRIGAAAKASPSCRIARMRPDWTTLVIDAPSGNPWALDARVVAYEYKVPASGGARPMDPVLLLPSEVMHYSPLPDPEARFRGMSWLTPTILEVVGDLAVTRHKLKFFENGAVHSLALKYPAGTPPERLKQYKKIFDEEYKGLDNAYKTFHVAGADPVPVSADLKQLDFKATQGVGETRICASGGVHPSLVGVSDGLQGSSLNSGNFNAARRLFVDTTVRDLWGKAAPSLQAIVPAPGADSRLWYDDDDIPFLREDAKDDADIRWKNSVTLRQLLDAGFNPDAAVEYVRTGNPAALTGEHSGRFSVQLQSDTNADANADGANPGGDPAPMPTLGAAA